MKLPALMIALIILASCATQQPKTQPTPQCAWPEIASDGGCCRDLNENGVCDTIDFSAEIEAEKQQEYEETARKARETAEQAGRLRRTIVNDLYDAASAIKSYRFLYKGDEVIVVDDAVTQKLLSDRLLGDQIVDGRRMKVVVNTIHLDFTNKEATAECVPPPRLVKQELGTQCDDFIGAIFDIPFDKFAFRLPIEWLEDFLHRTPYETQPGSHVGKVKTTLYRFTDLKDAQHKTNLWVDDSNNMPVRVEAWQGDKLVQQEQYVDLYQI